MSKFHINKNGVPAPCKAKPGNCPLGGDDQHFNSKEEAQVTVNETNAQEFGTLPGMSVEKTPEENVKDTFDEVYNEATNSVGGGTVGWRFSVHTNQEEDFGYDPHRNDNEKNEKLQQLFQDEFGEDSFVVEADENTDPMEYSLDSQADGIWMEYSDTAYGLKDPEGSGVVDENGEFTDDFRRELSDHLKANQGKTKHLFGKTFASSMSPLDGAKFVKEYANKSK